MKKLRVSQTQAAALSEARSSLWAIQQLTSKHATASGGGRAYLFELHQIARRGLSALEPALDKLLSRSPD